MKNRLISEFAFVIVSIILIGICCNDLKAQQVPLVKQPDINALVAMMEGSFSSEEQAANDSDYFNIILHMKKIWSERLDGKWLYVEQAVSGSEDKPYRQRIYRVDQLKDGSFISEVFTMNEPVRFAGAWKDESLLGDLTPDSLSAREGCAVYLSLADDGSFEGSTHGNECASDLRGAAYATSEVKITDTGILTWDRGFDSEGNQVWGATKGGYHFKKIPE